MRRALLLTAALAATAAFAGPAAGRAARMMNFESHKGQALAAGYISSNAFNDTGFSPQSTIAGACIKRWTGWAVSEANVLVGARGPGTQCDATQPLRLRFPQADNKYVGFYLIGSNPAGWTVTAYASNGDQLDVETAAQGKPDATNRWVSVTDDNGRIAEVHIAPVPGGAAPVEFGVDNLAWAD